MTRALGERPVGDGGAFDLRRLDWLDLRNMLLVARTVAPAALARTRKPRRASARGFSRHAAGVAGQPAGAAHQDGVALHSVPAARGGRAMSNTQ